MKSVLTFIIAGTILFSCSDSTSEYDLDDSSYESYTDEPSEPEDPKEVARRDSIEKIYSDIEQKLKDKAKRNWPQDYSTQEYWVHEQMVSFSYMNRIPDNDLIKQKAQRNWPLDFSTQEYWYDEQVEAKERLNKN